MSLSGGPDGDPISRQGTNIIGMTRDNGTEQEMTGIIQFSLGGDTSAPFAMAYVGTNGRVFNNPIIPNLHGTDNIFAYIVGELVADITEDL